DIDSAVKGIDAEVRAPIEGERPPIEEIASATVCLSCCRDHFSTISGALSEALRFARADGIASKEVQGRIGLALDEHNIMERVDLAPQAIAPLTGKEKELAVWSLKNSRELRHAIGEAKTVDDLEQAAALAAKLREEFMALYSEARQSYAEECVECEALTGLKEYLEQKRQK
ncbi:unnamed protein product, partial [marine sediment metagenome]